MKKISILILSTLLIFNYSCTLEEEPPFLANENVFSNADSAVKALDGIYSSMTQYFYYASSYHTLFTVSSGMCFTKRGGNDPGSVYNLNEGSLNVGSGSVDLGRVWKGAYSIIGRANDAIASIVPSEDPVNSDETIINDVLGQAYFVRAHTYFNLVRAWKEVPLRLTPTTSETINLAVSSEQEIYDQIIADCNSALTYMSNSLSSHYPKSYAVNMLLAKVYMQLAGNDSGSEYWQMAYDNAFQVYGNYTLVDDYASLFISPDSDGSSESIFEIQSSLEESLDFVRAFTPSQFSVANTFGWLKVNVDIYESHNTTYPGDSRMASTYISEFIRMPANNPNNTFKCYPTLWTANRNNPTVAFPFFFKWSTKDRFNDVRVGNQNFNVYRYADLLLMLAEISNELQNGQQTMYVEEVLTRSGLTPHDGYLGDQVSFRDAIMREYRYELLFEGEDWFNNRRRGHDWFLEKTVIPHNTQSLDDAGNVVYTFKANVDNTLRTDESIMKLPIPIEEVNSNELID